jgi:hypothetical protein
MDHTGISSINMELNFIVSLIIISLHRKHVQEFNVQLFQLLDFSSTDIQPGAQHYLLQLLADC